MTKILQTLLLGTLILGACSPILPSTEAFPQDTPPATETIPQVAPPSTEPVTAVFITTTQALSDSPALPIPKLSRTLETPHIDQPPDGPGTAVPSYPQGCGYQWAYKDLPELSASFLQSVQALQPEAQALAFGFGEDCVQADMSRTYIPMETDFNVTLQVSDPNDEAALGEWVVEIMQIIAAIPPEQISGPRPGRVSILFESNGERRGVNFYIDQYRALGAGLSYAEIYRALQAPQ